MGPQSISPSAARPRASLILPPSRRRPPRGRVGWRGLVTTGRKWPVQLGGHGAETAVAGRWPLTHRQRLPACPCVPGSRLCSPATHVLSWWVLDLRLMASPRRRVQGQTCTKQARLCSPGPGELTLPPTHAACRRGSQAVPPGRCPVPAP